MYELINKIMLTNRLIIILINFIKIFYKEIKGNFINSDKL